MDPFGANEVARGAASPSLKVLARAGQLRADATGTPAARAANALVERNRSERDAHRTDLVDASVIFRGANFASHTNVIHRAPPEDTDLSERQIIASQGVRPAKVAADFVTKVEKAIAMLYLIMDQNTGLVVGIDDHYGKTSANLQSPNGAEYNVMYLPLTDDRVLILRGNGDVSEIDATTAAPVVDPFLQRPAPAASSSSSNSSSSTGFSRPKPNFGNRERAYADAVGMRVAILRTHNLDEEGRFLERLVRVEEYSGASLVRSHHFVHIEAQDWRDQGIMSAADTTLLVRRFIALHDRPLEAPLPDEAYRRIPLQRAIVHCAAGIGRTGVVISLALAYMPLTRGRLTIDQIIEAMRFARGQPMVYETIQWCLVYYLTLFEAPDELVALLRTDDVPVGRAVRKCAAVMLQPLLQPYFANSGGAEVVAVPMSGLPEKQDEVVVVAANGAYVATEVEVHGADVSATFSSLVQASPSRPPESPPPAPPSLHGESSSSSSFVSPVRNAAPPPSIATPSRRTATTPQRADYAFARPSPPASPVPSGAASYLRRKRSKGTPSKRGSASSTGRYD